LQAIWLHHGHPATLAALKLSAFTFLRSGELRGGMWREIDWEAALWKVPAGRMKHKLEHWVPLSRQSLDVLRWIQPLTDHGPESLMFPGLRSMQRCTSNGTLIFLARTRTATVQATISCRVTTK
jgi:integrase